MKIECNEYVFHAIVWPILIIAIATISIIGIDRYLDREVKAMQCGYTQATLPGSSQVQWVKPNTP